MKRRQFLGLAALATGIAGCARLEHAVGKRRTVIVAGAGLAGLAAAEMLVRAGHEVTVLEAQARAGGRIRTLREPFADAQHAEAGALFIPQHHDLTLAYVKRFNLALERALPMFETRMLYVRGRRIVGEGAWPFQLTAEERKIGLRGMWGKYLKDALGMLGDMKAPDWPSGSALVALDRTSGADFLRLRGASPEAIALLRVGYLDMMGDGIDSYSALQLLHRLALTPGGVLHTIKGGTDLLPRALASELGRRIRYEAPVERIEPGDTSVSVVVRGERISADYLICTIPFSVLRSIEVSPGFSPARALVVQRLPYTSVARVFLQFRQRAWTAENLHVLTTTDLPMQWMYDHSANQPGPRGILEAQALGAHARRLARMPEAERIEFALSQVDQVFPGARKEFERGTSKLWDDDPWARGAFAYFRPGQMVPFRMHLSGAEGRVHFAGDHTSQWSGWMQGALESGRRAAREVIEAA